MARIAGNWELDINGTKMPVTGDVDCKGTGGKATKLIGPNGEPQGSKEEFEPPYVKGSFRITEDVDIERDIVNIRGAQITVTQPDGRVFVMNDSDFAADGNYMSAEGTMDFEYQGSSGDWVA
jgi:hypothetical protein